MRHNHKNTHRDQAFRRAGLVLENLEQRELMAAGPISVAAIPAPTLSSFSYASTVSDPVTIQGSAADPSASGYTYIWNYGDGSPAVQGVDLKQSSHVYAKSGSYSVSLTVVDPVGRASAPTVAPVSVSLAPIPEKARWESQMTYYGQNLARILDGINHGGTAYDLLGNTFYDAERTFLQIADYTQDPTWLKAADNAEKIYRDGYVVPNNGGVLGYWIFNTGLLMDYQKTGDLASRDAVLSLATNACYAPDSTDPTWTDNTGRSREAAYNIVAELNAEKLGVPRRERTYLLVDQALSHIDQWFVSKTAPYMQPFMVGLTMDALIQWYDATKDPRIPGAIKTAVDGLWARTWDAPSRSFVYVEHYYDGVGSPTPAADLNLLIAPAMAWLYHQTGDVHYRDIGDQAFAGGVDGAWLWGPKQFNQNYKWSFDYIKWRGEDPLSPSSDPGPALLAYTPQSGVEGASMKFLVGALTDTRAGAGPWTISIDWADGTPMTTTTVATTGLIPSQPHTFADSGVYRVKQTITSADGAALTYFSDVVIQNVAPVASIASGPYSSTTTLPVVIGGSAFDQSAADRASGFTYTWDFGDGSAPATGLNLSNPSHRYAAPGVYIVRMSVADKDGAVSSIVTASVQVTAEPIPELARWESQMLSYGATFAAKLNAVGANFTLTDLDGMNVFQQIADYTGDAKWNAAAQTAKSLYMGYVTPNNGGVTLGWAFTNGLTRDFLKNGATSSRDAVLLLSQRAAYVAASTPLAWQTDVSRSTAIAQGIETFMNLEAMGYGHNSRIESLVDVALGQLDQWFVSKTGSGDVSSFSQTLQALIRYQEKTGDRRILPAVKTALDWMWNNSYDPNLQGFRGINKASSTGFTSASPLSNLQIAPAFGWVYLKTGDASYRDRGDQAFAAGVRYGSVLTSRDFDAAYSWSFDFVKWRRAANG